ncbi:MAG: CPBP family intramembrane metalloprotease [Polyangiaceae bacterium]|nr:CPBP family intramembrane metalloprotease [Polyangiaceae bacterium]
MRARLAFSVRRRPLVAFFALAFTFSWALWLPRVAASFGWWGGARVASPYWHLAGSLGPAAAALVVARVAEGPAGLRALVSRLGRWRVGPRWWAAAVLGPLAVYTGAALAAAAVGARGPELRLLFRVAEYPTFGPLSVLAAEVVCYGYGEESGWRGFAQARLEARWGAARAVVVLSVLWALWHLPLLATNETYRAMGPLGLLGWYTSLLTGAALMAWLYRGARESVLVVAVFHGLLDVVMVNVGVSPATVPVMGALVTVWGVVAFVALARRRPPSRAAARPARRQLQTPIVLPHREMFPEGQGLQAAFRVALLLEVHLGQGEPHGRKGVEKMARRSLARPDGFASSRWPRGGKPAFCTRQPTHSRRARY